MIRRPPKSPLFPDTTLFGSVADVGEQHGQERPVGLVAAAPAGEELLDLAHERLGVADRGEAVLAGQDRQPRARDRKSTRLNSSHANISYAVFCLKKKNQTHH